MTPAEFLARSPADAVWVHGSLPPVESVPHDHLVVLWSPSYVGFVFPHGDSMNPLRWCDDTSFPQWGITPPGGWWTVVRQGSQPRPPQIRTWVETHGEGP